MKTPETLADAIRFFSNFENCRDYMVARRWPKGVTCPKCGSTSVYHDNSRKGWECKTRHPKRKFTLKTGTIFEDSPLGLDKWLPAVWMIANMKNGVSSHELARSLGVTQKTAWFMLHRIRLAMQSTSGGSGKARNMHPERRKRVIKGTGRQGKTAVMGLLNRHGKDGHSTIETHVVEGHRRHNLHPVVLDRVEDGSTVYTDELRSYNLLCVYYQHQVIDHGEYVDGQIHTNGCENFWSLLKRGLKGTYVAIEPFHLFRYLDEQVLRFNTRKMSHADRFARVLSAIVGRRLTYENRIAASSVNAPA